MHRFVNWKFMRLLEADFYLINVNSWKKIQKLTSKVTVNKKYNPLIQYEQNRYETAVCLQWEMGF